VTLLVLFILAVIWLAVLLPPYLQNRSESRPADSISSFQHQLSVLERRANPVGARSATPRSRYPTHQSTPRTSRDEARKRRRDVLFTLAGAAGITFLLAFMMGGRVWGLHLLCDVLLAGYTCLLAQANQRQMERNVKVRPLPVRRGRQAEPALLFRRSGS
jgi:hypothetical protein